MSDMSIEYEPMGIHVFEREIVGQLGEEAWREITDGGVVPDIKTEPGFKCANMAVFMERFDRLADEQTANRVLSKVRHGLKPSQSAWAREVFLEIGDLDAFIDMRIRVGIDEFENMLSAGRDFYGQPVTAEVVEFVKKNPGMLAGVRDGNKLIVPALPAEMDKYLKATCPKMKRYYACHCEFAKESILSEKTVSPTLCYCSLGHTLNFWESVFDTELTGKVTASALRGDEACSFVLTIPEEIMEKYVKPTHRCYQ